MGTIAENRLRYREESLPKWYSGKVHALALVTLIPALFVYSLSLVPAFSWMGVLTFFLTAFGIHLYFYLVHRFFLHRRVPYFDWAYRLHISHHLLYDHKNMTYEKYDDLYMMFLPPQIALAYYLLVGPSILLPLYYILPVDLFYYAVSSFVIFYGLHELSHYIEHLDGKNRLFRFKLFAWIRNHHLPHHNPRLMNKGSFDITFPCYDFVFGTDQKIQHRHDA